MEGAGFLGVSFRGRRRPLPKARVRGWGSRKTGGGPGWGPAAVDRAPALLWALSSIPVDRSPGGRLGAGPGFADQQLSPER